MEGQPAALREARLRVEAKLRQIITAKSHRVPFLKRDLVAWVDFATFMHILSTFLGVLLFANFYRNKKNPFIILTKWNSGDKE